MPGIFISVGLSIALGHPCRWAKFLKEYWGIRVGRPTNKFPQNEEIKTARDVAEAVGVDAKNLNRLIKLNDLIPELQSLVSSGKLGNSPTSRSQFDLT